MKSIIVCIKQVIDPDEPPVKFRIDNYARKVIVPGARYIVSPFDQNAVEAALRLKDRYGMKVIALSLGGSLNKNVTKFPLELGADELILLEDDAFDDGDSWSNSLALSKAIEKISNFGLILCGRQASDTDGGQVGSGIAEILGIPSITAAKKIELIENMAIIDRVTADGYEVFETSLPALITVSNELGEPRYPTIKQIMASKRKTIITWKASDIGVNVSKVGSAGRRSKLIKLFQPVKESKCEIINGVTSEEAGGNLALKLIENEVLSKSINPDLGHNDIG